MIEAPMNTPKTSELSIKKLNYCSVLLSPKLRLALAYLALLLLPFIVAQTLTLQFENTYRTVLSALTLIAMMAFFVQFPLAGRLKQIPMFANIDWNIAQHKKLGKYLGIFFFLHPLLMLAPKMLLSFNDFSLAFMSMLTAPKLLTGLIAWGVMVIWILMSIFKDKLKMTYETWHLLHLVGFVVIVTLATLHLTSVGSHGQYHQGFNLLWWGLYGIVITLVIYNYLFKLRSIKQRPFVITEIKKVNDCDWLLSVTGKFAPNFDFEAGQFVWLNSSKSIYNLKKHPFSIITPPNNESKLSFIIRELGDYTRTLNTLKIGQEIFVDGPYGNLTLAPSKKSLGITLIAAGSGIAPMLGLLRELAEKNDKRPIRLLYANQSMKKMVCLDELFVLQQQMVNFKLQLFIEQDLDKNDPLFSTLQQGRINKQDIETTINNNYKYNWAIYLCGPKKMMNVTQQNVKQIGIPSSCIHFENFSF